MYQWVHENVKPERDANRRDTYRLNWWIFGEPRATQRDAFGSVSRYVATCRTARHRLFSFVPAAVIFESKVVGIASDEAYVLGVLSSRTHVVWADAAGGWLGVGNDATYNHVDCFNKFPFPVCNPEQQEKIRALGEQLDAHRKRQQALHPALTFTGMYNVLEAVRAGQTLSAKERAVYDQGLVGILKELHDQLDAAVAEAYGWPTDLSTEQILERLVALNAERAAEEARGLVRWLRPEYQAKGEAVQQAAQGELDVEEEAPPPAPTEALPWPKELPAQAAALSTVLAALPAPATVAEIATHFAGKATQKRLDEIARLLETLEALGRASHIQGDRWLAAR